MTISQNKKKGSHKGEEGIKTHERKSYGAGGINKVLFIQIKQHLNIRLSAWLINDQLERERQIQNRQPASKFIQENFIIII